MFKNAKMIYFKDLTNNPKNCWKEKYLGVPGDIEIHCSKTGQWIELIPYLLCPPKGIGKCFHTSVGCLKKSDENKEIELVTNHSVYRFRYEKEEENI